MDMTGFPEALLLLPVFIMVVVAMAFKKDIMAWILAVVMAAILFSPMLNAQSYSADLVRVIDGDTIKLDIGIWPGLLQRISVRLRGINTPESRTRNLCEKALGKAATAHVDFLVQEAELEVHDVKFGKFAGRILGKVTADGVDIGESLIVHGHATYYYGEKRGVWPGCE